MEIHELFRELHQKLEALQHKAKQPLVNPIQIEAEIEELKKKSEEIVEEWLSFEGKLGQYLQEQNQQKMEHFLESHPSFHSLEQLDPAHEQLKQVYDEWYQSSSEHEPQFFKQIKADALESWKKGRALYDLLMFEHAIPFLEQTLQEDPDLDAARLFLAHSYLAVNEREKSIRQFQFLSETAESKEISDLALHGLGCIAGALKQFERSVAYFEKIDIESVRPEWQSIFLSNYGISLYELEQYNLSLEQWRKYYELTDNDWKGPYMLGKIYMALNDEESGLAFWFEALQMEETPTLLLDMAQHFEQKAFHAMAAQCYERLLKNQFLPLDAQIWFGLAWNQGLSQQRAQAEVHFLKALSLFPAEIELQIAYTWMLLFWEDQPKALKSLLSLQKRYPHHPLVVSLTYLYEGKFGEANEVLTAHLHTY